MENLNKEEGEELHDNNRRAESGVPLRVPGLTSDQPRPPLVLGRCYRAYLLYRPDKVRNTFSR